MVVDDRVEVDSGQELEAEFDGGSRSYSHQEHLTSRASCRL